jgi:hypothetical protein
MSCGGGHLGFPIGIKNRVATARLSLILDPMEKMFQNASFLKPLGQLKPNCPGIVKLSPAVAAILNFISKQKP